MRALSALALLFFLGALPARLGAQPIRVDGVAAIIGDAFGPGATFLLWSDVDLRARMHLSRELAGPSIGGEAPSSAVHSSVHLGALPQGLKDATRDELVGEVLIQREAIRVGIQAPTLEAIETARTELAELTGGEERLHALTAALGVSDRELQRILVRRAYVRAFLESYIQVQEVDDDAVETAYDAGEHPFLGQDLEDVREALRVWLTRRAIDRSVQDWISALAGRTHVRLR